MWRNRAGNWLDEPEANEETIDVPYEPSWRPDKATPSALPVRDGLIIDRPDLRLLDTREMPWEDFDGWKGAKVKVLSRDASERAMVMLVWMPPGPRRQGRHRHYHRTVRENGFILAGELPHWEYADASQARGEVVMFREGFYMDRPPGGPGLHGSEPGGPVSETGCLLLTWRDGVGNWLNEPEATSETVEVPYPDGTP
jgi:hypothetical protein